MNDLQRGDLYQCGDCLPGKEILRGGRGAWNVEGGPKKKQNTISWKLYALGVGEHRNHAPKETGTNFYSPDRPTDNSPKEWTRKASPSQSKGKGVQIKLNIS